MQKLKVTIVKILLDEEISDVDVASPARIGPTVASEIDGGHVVLHKLTLSLDTESSVEVPLVYT